MSGATHRRPHRLPKRPALLAAVVLLPAVAVTGWYLTRPSPAQVLGGRARAMRLRGMRSARGDDGPWGTLELTPITIQPPEEFLRIDPDEHPTWFFAGQPRAGVVKLLESSGAARSTLEALVGSPWREEAGGTWITPAPDAVLALEPGPRHAIYETLARAPANRAQREPFTIPPESLEERLRDVRLDAEAEAQFRRLLYLRGSYLILADAGLFFPRLPGPARQRLTSVVLRRNTYLVSLHVDEHADIGTLAAYWGPGPRTHDIRPLLESLTHVPGGDSVDIIHLLPPFARQRLYTFPHPERPAEAKHDCWWSALNFFSETPDDRFLEAPFVMHTLQREYEPLPDGTLPRFGDLVVFFDPDNQPVHVSVFVADDIVFTKNGSNLTSPWLLRDLPSLLDLYQAVTAGGERLRTVIVRHKGGPGPTPDAGR